MASNTNQDLFGDSSSDDDDDDQNVADPQGKSESETTAAKPARPSIHDDSDEDDNQFDDKGAVVGLPSKTMAGSKLNESSQQNNDAAGASDDDDDDNDLQPKGPEIITQTKLLAQTQHKVPDDTRLYMTKLPNLVGIQTQAFDPSTYAPALEEEEYGQSVYNLIRWRYKKESGQLVRDSDDKLVRESNTRIVEWEDGSYTLHIGQESFEVDHLDSKTASGFPGLNGFIYQSQKATIVDRENEDIEHKSAGTILECSGPVQARFTVRPSSLQSDAHKSLTVGIRQKTVKTARIAQYVTQEDPEKAKQERIRIQDDIKKASGNKRRSGGGGYRQHRPKMSRSYLEEDDANYDSFNIKDAKRKAREGDDDEDLQDFGDDSSSSEDEYDETFKRVNTKKAKVDENKSTAAPAVADDDDDDDEDEDEMKVSVKAKKPAKAVFDDSDSD